ASERSRRAPAISSAVSRSGAFEFDDGSVELHSGGVFRTVLGTAGTPVRVVVTRQEEIPSQRDPIFCRIKNRAFFAFKIPPTLPPAAVRFDDRLAKSRVNPFQTAIREHVDRAAATGAALTPALALRVGYGAAMASTLAASVGNRTTVATGTVWRFAL